MKCLGCLGGLSLALLLGCSSSSSGLLSPPTGPEGRFSPEAAAWRFDAPPRPAATPSPAPGQEKGEPKAELALTRLSTEVLLALARGGRVAGLLLLPTLVTYGYSPLPTDADFDADTAAIYLSPGARYVTFRDGRTLGILELRTRLVQTFPQLDGNAIVMLDVTDAGQIAYVGIDNQLHLFDPSRGEDQLIVTAGRGLGRLSDVSITGDGRFVAYSAFAGGVKRLFVVELANGRQRSLPFIEATAEAAPQRTFELDLAGEQLLYSEDGQLRVLSLASGTIDRLPLLEDELPVQDAQFLDEGGDLIFFARGDLLRTYDRRRALLNLMVVTNLDLDAAFLEVQTLNPIIR